MLRLLTVTSRFLPIGFDPTGISSVFTLICSYSLCQEKEESVWLRQVGDWKFTYQDRIRSFPDVDPVKGYAALSAYAVLFGRVERDLFAQFSARVSLTSLKNAYLIAYRIPARMFNSVRVSVEGKISAVRESMDRQIASLDTLRLA